MAAILQWNLCFCMLLTRGFVVVHLLSHVRLCDPMNCSTPGSSVLHFIPRVCSNSLSQSCYLIISSSVAFFSFCPQSFPASGIFPVSQLFASDDQSTGASASVSVLPMSIQGWFPLRLAGLSSLLSKGLSGVFSSTTVRRHQFFNALPSLRSSCHNRMWQLGRP